MRGAMLTSILYIIMMSAPIAAADPQGWGKLLWGMSPEQARAAEPAASVPAIPVPGRTFDRRESTLGIDRIAITGVDCRALFFFDPARGLDRIIIQPLSRTDATPQQYISIESALVAKYGRPFERRTDDRPHIRMAQWSYPATTIILRYTDFRPQVQLSTLYLIYMVRATDPNLD